jgi:hypothetical protein
VVLLIGRFVASGRDLPTALPFQFNALPFSR